MHWTSRYRLRSPDQPPPDMGYWDLLAPSSVPRAIDIWWPSLDTCTNLFIRPHCTGPPLVLTSGGDRSTCDWQAGSMYATGMLSCYCWVIRQNLYFLLHLTWKTNLKMIISRKEKSPIFPILCCLRYFISVLNSNLRVWNPLILGIKNKTLNS